MMHTIYYIPCKCGDMYVGQTTNIQRRQEEHRVRLFKNNRPKNLHFRRCCMTKKEIKLYPLHYCKDKQEANIMEAKLIQKFGKLNKVKCKYDFNYAEYYEKHKEKIKQKKKEYYEKNKEKLKQQKKEYYEKNKKILTEKSKINYEKNKKIIKQQRKQKIICPICNTLSTRSNFKRHQKTKKCITIAKTMHNSQENQ